jgi:DNA-binding beta-propeller fold protein YncE
MMYFVRSYQRLLIRRFLLTLPLILSVFCSEGLETESILPGSGGGGGEETITPPPEQEIKYLLSQPSATDIYVFVANTTLNSVTKINVNTLRIDSIPVGLKPTIVRTTPDNKKAIVLNSGDYTVSIVDANTDSVTTLPVIKYANNLSLSPTGKHAVVFYDPALESGSLEIDPTRTFNEISIIDIAAKTSTKIAVDFLPRAVKFTPEGNFAGVITNNYLDMVDLNNNYSLTIYSLTSNPSQFINPSELEITPDGNFALVLVEGTNTLVAVDFSAKSKTEITVGPQPTDLEVYPDSSMAMVVNKGDNSITLIDLPSLTTSTVTPSGIEIGQAEITPDTSFAVLFTNSPSVPQNGEFIHLMKLTDNSITTYPVIKGVDAVLMAPINQSTNEPSAFIIHRGPGGTSTDPIKQFFYNHYAVTVFNLITTLSNPVALEAKPEGFAFSADGAYGFGIMPSASAFFGVNMLSQITAGVNLLSAPSFIGVMPGSHRAYISAEHPLGRIIFVDADDNYRIDTVTGFELKTK